MGFLDKNFGGYLGYYNNTNTGTFGLYKLNDISYLSSQNMWHSKIVTNNLIINLDNSKIDSFQQTLTNYSSTLPMNDWVVGTGGTTFFTANGDGNSRINGIDPYGNNNVLWHISGQDAASDADGGWNTTNILIDNTKLYRFSVWVRRRVIGNGSTYFGTNGFSSADANVGVLNRQSLATDTNAYFYYTKLWPAAVDEWLLIVGHVWPVNSGSNNSHIDSGVYNQLGTKIADCTDFIWQSTTVKTQQRAYLYYSTDTTTVQQFACPRIDVCDGTEPTIYTLLNGTPERKWYDLSGNGNNLIFGSRLYGQIPFNANTITFNSEHTIEIWMKPNRTIANNRTNPYNQAYGGGGTITHETNGVMNYFWGTAGTDATPYTALTSTFTVLDGELACICVTRNTSTVTWYKNGAFNVSSANGYPSTVTGTLPIYIGNGYTTKAIGGIYSVRVYNRCLTAGEVLQNFEAMRRFYGI